MPAHLAGRRSQTLVAATLCAAIVLTALGFTAAAPAQSVRAIVQGRSIAEVESAVQALGGFVTHRFALIQAVSADMPESALGALRNRGLHVTLDTPVRAAGRPDANSSGFAEAVGATVPSAIPVGAFTENSTPDDSSDDPTPPFSSSGPTETGFVKPELLAP